MHRNNKKTNDFRLSGRLVGNILTPVFAIVVLMTVFSFQPKGFAKGNEDSNGTSDTHYVIDVQETSKKLPAQWTWKKEAINFDHMYPSKR